MRSSKSSCFQFSRRSSGQASTVGVPLNLDKTRKFLTEWLGLSDAQVEAELKDLNERDAALLYSLLQLRPLKNMSLGNLIREIKEMKPYDRFCSLLFSVDGLRDDYLINLIPCLIQSGMPPKEAMIFLIERSDIGLQEIKENASTLSETHKRPELIMACLYMLKNQKEHYELAFKLIVLKKELYAIGFLYNLSTDNLTRLDKFIMTENLSLLEARKALLPAPRLGK